MKKEFKVGDFVFFKYTKFVLATSYNLSLRLPETYWINHYKPAKPGIAIITNIVKNQYKEGNNICQLLFNNTNGVRYIYKNNLERELDEN